MQKLIKLVKFLYLLLFVKLTWAADTSSIQGLNKTLTSGQELVQIAAKWGGMALIVAGGIMIGLGKAKAEALSLIVYILLGLGLIIAAWGWWPTIFSNGFAW